MPARISVSKASLIVWRRQKVITRIRKPTKIARARTLGYKAKQGYVMLRVRVDRGKRKRPKIGGGRRPKRFGKYFTLGKSRAQVAEEKAQRKYPNLNVMNSYYVAEDGVSRWFEIIMVNPKHPAIKKDKERKWITSKKQKGRAFRGLTSAGRKSRGLRKK